mgnify:CR=1 FL=1
MGLLRIRSWDIEDYERPKIRMGGREVSFRMLLGEIASSKEKLWIILPKSRRTNEQLFLLDLAIGIYKHQEVLPIILIGGVGEFEQELSQRMRVVEEAIHPLVLDKIQHMVIYYPREGVDKGVIEDIANRIDRKIVVVVPKSDSGRLGKELGAFKNLVIIKKPFLSIADFDEVASLFIIFMIGVLIISEFLVMLEIVHSISNVAIPALPLVLVLSIITHALTGIGKAVDLIHGVRALRRRSSKRY